MNREIKPGPRKGLVIVNTGNGKGKTTAALGVLFRSLGRNLRVVMLQFIKSRTHLYGEHLTAKKWGVEIIPLGDGFTWESKNIDFDKQLAAEGWAECKSRIESAEYDVVILDELTYLINYGWLDLNEVLNVLRARDPNMHVIITGRDAPAELIEFADLVSEVKEIKHPFKRGIRAQIGIEL
ncbi:MAG TPA: cob(I)yrinic acid a,c-diamide adenosyltransferase [Blastocatellia bacterium]